MLASTQDEEAFVLTAEDYKSIGLYFIFYTKQMSRTGFTLKEKREKSQNKMNTKKF